MLYALKIRKSDLPLLTILNGDVEPEIEKKTTYLVIAIDGAYHTTKIVTERELFETCEISSRGPLLLKLKK